MVTNSNNMHAMMKLYILFNITVALFNLDQKGLSTPENK